MDMSLLTKICIITTNFSYRLYPYDLTDIYYLTHSFVMNITDIKYKYTYFSIYP